MEPKRRIKALINAASQGKTAGIAKRKLSGSGFFLIFYLSTNADQSEKAVTQIMSASERIATEIWYNASDDFLKR